MDSGEHSESKNLLMATRTPSPAGSRSALNINYLDRESIFHCLIDISEFHDPADQDAENFLSETECRFRNFATSGKQLKTIENN
jgi:hypothetical protein